MTSSNATPNELPPIGPRPGGMKAMAGSEVPPFGWEVLVPRLVHPVKVAVIEALLWVDRPLSATDLMKLFNSSEMGLSHVSYHVRTLAKIGILEKVSERPVRGSIETFYGLR